MPWRALEALVIYYLFFFFFFYKFTILIIVITLNDQFGGGTFFSLGVGKLASDFSGIFRGHSLDDQLHFAAVLGYSVLQARLDLVTVSEPEDDL